VYTPEQLSDMTGFLPQVIQQIITEPYRPAKYLIEYGQSAVNSNSERLQKIDWLIQRFGPALNPMALLQMSADALDLEYDDNMIIQGAMMQPQSGGGQNRRSKELGVSTAGNRQDRSPV